MLYRVVTATTMSTTDLTLHFKEQGRPDTILPKQVPLAISEAPSQLSDAHGNRTWPFPWWSRPDQTGGRIDYRNSKEGAQFRFEENFPDFWSERYTGGPMRMYHSHPLAHKLNNIVYPGSAPNYWMANYSPVWRRPDYYSVQGNPFR